jgi:hypothetical protein
LSSGSAVDKRFPIGRRERAVTEKANVFLRWMRLKHDAKTTAHQAAAASTGVEAATEQPAGNAAMQEPFDLASLPSIDSITADTDIVAFLKAGVPNELARAALRRAWTSDPTIRDFIGVADNQWDFNDPNGIFGFGPLDATESGAAVMPQLSSTPAEMPDWFEEKATRVEHVASNAVCSERPGPDQHARPDVCQSHSADSVVSSCAVSEAGADAKAEHDIEEDDACCGRRSHGSALPK